MKNALWFLVGIIGGFVAAHFVNKDPRGREVLADVDARISEFTDRMGLAYREQEAKIESLVGSAKDAAGDAFETVKDVAGDTYAKAKDAVTDTDGDLADAVGTARDAADNAADAAASSAENVKDAADDAADHVKAAAAKSSDKTAD